MIHPTRKYSLLPLALLLAVALIGGTAHAASLVLGYGGTTTSSGVGVYPQRASANSERYFRCIVGLATGTTPESLVSLYVSGPSGQTQLFPDPNGPATPDVQAGVARYTVSSGSTTYTAWTIGPYAGRDIWWNPHAAGEVIGTISQDNGHYGYPFTFYATTVSGTTFTNHSVSGVYYTQHDDADILEWFAGDAAGIDPLGVTDSPTPGIDNGSSSNTYRFRVQYRILPQFALNLLSRWGTPDSPPGPYANFADFDNGAANAVSRGDRTGGDRWIYSPGLGQPPPEWSGTYPRFDDYSDQVNFYVSHIEPEVVVIIDGDRSRPHFMQREDPSDSTATDLHGIRYFYDLLPTDYANFMDNLFLFPYDQPGPDPQDGFQTGIRARCVSNNYVALTVGGHTYEFMATDDYSPPEGNRAWVTVGQPGQAEYNDYVKPVIGSGGQMTSTRARTWFPDLNGSGGFGYPYNSQDASQYPQSNPMLTAHPYFGQVISGSTRNTVTPASGPNSVNPAGSLTNPFTAEVGAGPNPPQRITNDDTILPNFVNIQPNTDTNPFRGGKWTTASTYTLRVNYWQSNDIPPGYIRVLVRKNNDGAAPGSWVGYTMEKANPTDNTYTDGCVYQYITTPEQLPGGGGPGDYNYYFVASDGIRQAIYPNRPARHEYSGGWNDPADLGVPITSAGDNDYYAFRVNQAPALSNQTVNPVSGSSGANYQFRVTYTDPDGEMLNTASEGDRPFEASIYVDLFGSPEGQARVVSVQNNTTLTYSTDSATGYPTNSLVGHTVEMQTGTAAGRSYNVVGNTTTQITVAGGSTLLTDGVASGNRIRLANWFHGTMLPEIPSDLNYADGKTFVFDSATQVVLGPGSHRYHFEFKDDWGSWVFPADDNVRVEGEKVRYPFTGEFDGPEVQANHPPVLTDFRFTPHALSGPDGTTATPFILSVTYRDEDNNPPSLIRLGIDGTAAAPAIILQMNKDPNDNVYTDGVIYSSDPVKLAEGQHIFRAQASDGTARYPASTPPAPFVFAGPPSNPNDFSSAPLDNVNGPLVTSNTPPTLSFEATDNGSDPNNPPGLDPNTGRVTTTFTYTIIYTDSDRFAGVAGNPPDYVRVFIDSTGYDMVKVNPTDNDYTDGATYQFQYPVPPGLQQAQPHRYYFVASDGLDQVRRPRVGVSPNYYAGPVVDEPPGPPQSLLAQDHANDNGGVIDLTFNASNDDGGGANDVTEYRVYRSTSAGQYNNPPVLTIPATGVPTYAVQDNSAVTGTDYYYVVRAWDAANESDNSNEAGPVKAIDNIPPQPPTNVAVQDPGLGGTIVVSWQRSTDDGGGQNDVTEYLIYRATTPTGFGGVEIGRVPVGSTSYTDQSVADGTNYYYMVRATDGSNLSVDSNVAGPIASTDQEPPVFSNLNPAHRAVDVPIDTTISFVVTDTGTGVDRDSIVTTATVDGVPVDIGTPSITGTRAQYTVVYSPPQPFDFRKVVNVNAAVSDLAGQDKTQAWRFTTAGPATYTISGTITNGSGVPKANVLVSAGALSALTDAAGNYMITGLVNGTYPVKPTLREFAFLPESQPIVINDASVANVNFTWQPGFDITGRVRDEAGNGMQGVTVTDGSHNAITDGNGRYELLDLPAGTYTVAPSLPRYMFTPASRQVTVGPSVASVNFTGALQTYSISGVVTDTSGARLSPIPVDAIGPSGTVQGITNVSGQYTISGLLPGRYVVTPRKAEYVFRPLSQEVDVDSNLVDINFVGVPVYQVGLPRGWSFVAVPVTPEDPSALAVFGNVPIFRWDPTGQFTLTGQPDYVAANNNPALPFSQVAPGKGFFVNTRSATTANVAGIPTSANLNQYLLLQDGWNMAGNPYAAPLPWANVGATTGGPVSDFAYVFDQSRGYLLVSEVPGVGAMTAVPQNAGMWVKSSGPRTVTISPVSSLAARRHEPWTRSEGEFVIPIVAEAGGSIDSAARAGVVHYAATNPAAYVIDNPPMMAKSVDVYFTGPNGRLLTCDIRGSEAANLTYDFVVRTDLKNTSVKVSLPDLSQVSRDQAVVLTDVASGRRMWARTMSAYSYNSGQGGDRQFRLEITPNTGGGLTATLSPAAARGGAVSISYTLSRPANVQMTVLNLAGRPVRTVVRDKAATAGLNTEAWDLRNEAGAKVPPGRYLIRLEAAGEDGQKVSAVAPLMVQ